MTENLTLNTYQQEAAKIKIYTESISVLYPAIGLSGEAGEVLEIIKKVLRKGRLTKYGLTLTPDEIKKVMNELGDVLWYLTVLAADLDIKLSEVATQSLTKLKTRKEINELKNKKG